MLLIATPARSAERITGFFGSLQLSLSVDALEAFVDRNQVTDELAFYTKRLSPEQLKQFRQVLEFRLPASPVLFSQVGYSKIGESLLQQAGDVIQTETGENGFYALRSALILSATQPNGTSFIQLLRNFPSRSVRIDFNKSLRLAQAVLAQQQQTINVFRTLAAQAEVDTRSPLSDLRKPGSVTWRQQTWTIHDTKRDRTFPVDLYLPQTKLTTPLVVIVHGAVEDRQTFANFAQHLASYGFAVAVPENPNTSQRRWGEFLRGLAPEPDAASLSDQPLDVRSLLDELARQAQTQPALQRLNLQQVGVIGHSQGGTTALFLAGATIDPDRQQRCQTLSSTDIIGQIQCGSPLPSSSPRDPRIVAAIAINPVTSLIFGSKGMSQLQVPVMLVSSSADMITPPINEQICPFTGIQVESRYLALIENGTHLSMLGENAFKNLEISLPPLVVGADPAVARSFLNGVGLAFVQRYVANQTDFQPYLSNAYSRSLSTPNLKLTLLRQIPEIPKFRHDRCTATD